MKRFLLFSSMLILSTSVYAQKMEVEISYGAPSIYGVSEEIMGSIVSALSSSDYSNSSNGILNVAVARFNDVMKWRYGVEFGSEFFSTSGKLTSLNYYSISPKIDYFWSPPENKLRFYSGISAGVVLRASKYYDQNTSSEESETDTVLGLNFTPLGIRYGEDFAVFLDGNTGNKAIVQLGINYAF